MRKLTFEGFLKQYVAELSGVQTVSIHKLADCLSENPRLKEPLFLYALAYDKVERCSATPRTALLLRNMSSFPTAIHWRKCCCFWKTSRRNCRRATGKSGAVIVQYEILLLQTMTQKI